MLPATQATIAPFQPNSREPSNAIWLTDYLAEPWLVRSECQFDRTKLVTERGLSREWVYRRRQAAPFSIGLVTRMKITVATRTSQERPFEDWIAIAVPSICALDSKA
jgi:hypothetical protein